MADTCTDSASYLALLAETAGKLQTSAVDQAVDRVFHAWREDRQVFCCGNGGSHYTASHHVTDYVKTAMVEGRRRLRAMALGDNEGLLTAIGNDISYDEIFTLPLETHGRPGDLLVAISCSGTSRNVVRAVETALEKGIDVIAITGFTGGTIGAMASIHINIPSRNFGVIEDLQMSVGHVIAQGLQARVAASPAE